MSKNVPNGARNLYKLVKMGQSGMQEACLERLKRLCAAMGPIMGTYTVSGRISGKKSGKLRRPFWGMFFIKFVFFLPEAMPFFLDAFSSALC